MQDDAKSNTDPHLFTVTIKDLDTSSLHLVCRRSGTVVLSVEVVIYGEGDSGVGHTLGQICQIDVRKGATCLEEDIFTHR